MKKVLLGAVAVAAVLVPAATAGSTASVELALLPLPKAALGAGARHLPVARDSGVVSNADAANDASGHVTARRLSRLGRIGGYLLDYGNPFATSAGIREVQTEIDRYRSPAAALGGLAFWRRDELKQPPKGLGVQLSVKRLRIARLPRPGWAYAGSASIEGLKPIEGVDAQFVHGPYVLDVSVAAGSNAAAARLVARIAGRFQQRLERALAGRLHARPVALPPAPRPGPPPRGPKPSALVLRPADLGQGAKVLHKGYSKPKSSFDQNALSVYDLTLESQGTFPVLSQQVIVGGSALEAKYFAAVVISGAAAGAGAGATPVDLSGVGDNARGVFLQVATGGETVDEEAVVLTRGSYLDFAVEARPSAFTAADVRKLATLAAKRLNG